MEKLLTVVIPAYNAEKYITYTLDSLCAGCKVSNLRFICRLRGIHPGRNTVTYLL